jgi:formylglycine-generating enzyme required for sulfatase activity
LFSRFEDQVLVVPKDLVVSQGAMARRGGGAVEEGQVTVGVYSVGGQEAPKVLEVSLEVARDLQQRLREGNVGQAFAKLRRTFDLSGAGLAGGPVAVGAVIPALDEAQVGLAARFIPIEPGTFLMGSPAHEMGRFDGETLHEVTLTHRILVQATPVTQRQFREIMGYDPSYFHGDGTGNHPVETVTWYDAVEFANRLSLAAGLKPAYRIQVKKRRTNGSIEDAKVEVNGRNIYETVGYKEGKAGFRLATEAEGEYFTRAGSNSPYSFGSDVSLLGNYAWYDQNSSVQTHEVGMKNPNAWGIYDVHGNVYEWRQDGYEESYSEVSVIDPTGSGSRQVIRGGSWRNDPGRLRSAHRTYDDPDARWYVVGLRLVRSIP